MHGSKAVNQGYATNEPKLSKRGFQYKYIYIYIVQVSDLKAYSMNELTAEFVLY